MTLDEAIKHCEEKAKELKEKAGHEKQNQLNKVKMFNGHFPADYTKANDCLECAKEHEQLAKWLKDYRRLLEERPQGEWIYTNKEDKEKGYGGYCSNCKCDMPVFNEDWKMKYSETNFCPNCGADMRKPNCVTCDHFGKCDGCEKGEEE